MQVSIFNVPAGDALALEEMNRFLRGHRILTLDRQWTGAGWSFCATWQPPAGTSTSESAAKVDYKAVLDAPTFALFSRLREIRKALAEKENLPPYAVFTNEQLAAIAKGRCATPADLGKIDGIGAARIEKYGKAVLAAVAAGQAAPAA
jgi:superfamily II DNA helicase RecQ